jgi:porin
MHEYRRPLTKNVLTSAAAAEDSAMQGLRRRSRVSRYVVVAGAIGALLQGSASPAVSEPNSQDETAAPRSSAPSLPEVLRQLTDPGGSRSRLEQAGLQFTFTYYGDGFTNPRGGVSQGTGYAGRFGTIIDGDLEKLVGWSGASFHASFHQIHSTDFSANRLQSLSAVSGIEAPTSTRLFNLWVEQKIGTPMNLRVGQFTAAQEFLVSDNAVLFVNSTFGWPLLPAQDLPSGGPAYPEATPGVRLSWTPTDQLTVRAAIFNGDPAGPGAGNPVQRDPYGLAFRVSDPPLLIAELAYAYNQTKSSPRENPHQEGGGSPTSPRSSTEASTSGTGLPGTLKLGAWLHTGQFADQRFDGAGGLLAVSGAAPLQHSGNFGIYGIIDQMLWRATGKNGQSELNAFLRVVATPADRNLIAGYIDAGLTYKGPFDMRPNDIVGLGVAYGRVSPRAAQFDRDVVKTTGATMPIRDFEAIVEVTYQVQFASNWSVQPTLQYIVHPGGHVPDPGDPSGAVAIRDAFVVGVRNMLKF